MLSVIKTSGEGSCDECIPVQIQFVPQHTARFPPRARYRKGCDDGFDFGTDDDFEADNIKDMFLKQKRANLMLLKRTYVTWHRHAEEKMFA